MRPTPVSILRLLADARPRDEDELVRTLGIPRDELRREIDALSRMGVPIERDAGGAIRTAIPLDLLDDRAVRAALPAPLALEIVDACESTNALMAARAAAGAPSGSVLACEMQTAGRGRRGTAWLAPPGGALAFSVLWRLPRAGAALAGLPLAVGVACVRALERCGVRGVQLKWPNDIVFGGRKLGGILVEASPDGAGSAVVCGVGLNTRLPAGVRAAIAQPATDVAAACAHPPSRSALLAALLGELGAALERFASAGLEGFRDEWLRHHAHQGQPVELRLADARTVAGRALGIADDGALLIEHAGRVERFHSGEVSLRAA
jgi:BirA family biotin operon repressor/biotin-[acetyl-CoA-carboxylase] ligase